MIKLYFNKNKTDLCKEYSYNEDDLLNPSNVKMYQFSPTPNGKSHLEKLEYNPNGFIVPTFNEAIGSLSEEVYAFQEEEWMPTDTIKYAIDNFIEEKYVLYKQSEYELFENDEDLQIKVKG